LLPEIIKIILFAGKTTLAIPSILKRNRQSKNFVSSCSWALASRPQEEKYFFMKHIQYLERSKVLQTARDARITVTGLTTGLVNWASFFEFGVFGSYSKQIPARPNKEETI
jgi:hypothetical protein